MTYQLVFIVSPGSNGIDLIKPDFIEENCQHFGDRLDDEVPIEHKRCVVSNSREQLNRPLTNQCPGCLLSARMLNEDHFQLLLGQHQLFCR